MPLQQRLFTIGSQKDHKGRYNWYLVLLDCNYCRKTSTSRPLCLSGLNNTNRIRVSNSYTVDNRSNMNMLLAEHISPMRKLRLPLPARLRQVAKQSELGSLFLNTFFAPFV